LQKDADRILGNYLDRVESITEAGMKEGDLTSSKFRAVIMDFTEDFNYNATSITNAAHSKMTKLYDQIINALDVSLPLDYNVLPSTQINSQQIINEVQAVINEYRSGNLTELETKRLISGRIQKPAHIANTIINTQVAGWDNETTRSVAALAQLTHYLYFGPISDNTRPFCRARVGQTFTEAELHAMDNGQGLPVIRYLGGYNCLHELIPVNPAWKELKLVA